MLVLSYLPSNCADSTYNEFGNFIANSLSPILSVEDHLVVMGDFNFSKIEWYNIEDVLTPLNSNSISSFVLDNVFGLGLKQINHIHNQHGNILDLVFVPVTSTTTISECDDLGNSSSIYHTPLNFKFYFDSVILSNKDFIIPFSFDFKRGDYAGLNSCLDTVDWSFLTQDRGLDEQVVKFYDVLKAGMEKYIPKKRHTNQYREPWYNPRLINLKNKKTKAHKKYKRDSTMDNYEKYCSLRDEFKILNRFLYDSYIVQIESEIKMDPKRFWSFVDSKRHCKGFPEFMAYNSESSNDPTEICNYFASFFKSVYNNPTDDFNEESSAACFTNFKLDLQDILISLNDLDPNKGIGPDGISPFLLKQCAFQLSFPLTQLFNRSLSTGCFPEIWKTAFIKPIFKSGFRHEVSNYRGIAILSAIPKLFEKLVKDVMLFYVKQYVSPRQHGFYPGRSTTTNLTILTNFVSKALESGDRVQAVYTDFSKAFDKVDHSKLILKLDELNCEYVPIKWISSYLQNRQQIVNFHNVTSDPFVASSGVPQGSHLGPLLFILFINDVCSCFLNSEILMYADDLKIYKIIRNDTDMLEFQSDLNRFASWCHVNKLFLNVSKCKTMCFNRKRNNLENNFYLDGILMQSVESFIDLGVNFTVNLSFNRHIEKCICKAYSMLGFLIRFSRDFHDPYTLKILYCSYVRSNLEYASIIWSPYYLNMSDRIESIQKKFMMFALRRLPRNPGTPRFILPSYLSRCQLINIQPLYVRRSVACVVFIRDILTARVDCSDVLRLLSIYVPMRQLRCRDFSIRLEHHWTNYGRSEPVFNASRLFNLAVEIFDFEVSRTVFRKAVVTFFLNSNIN